MVGFALLFVTTELRERHGCSLPHNRMAWLCTQGWPFTCREVLVEWDWDPYFTNIRSGQVSFISSQWKLHYLAIDAFVCGLLFIVTTIVVLRNGKARQCWFQFHVKDLLFLTLFLGVLYGVYHNHAEGFVEMMVGPLSDDLYWPSGNGPSPIIVPLSFSYCCAAVVAVRTVSFVGMKLFGLTFSRPADSNL